MLDSQTVAEKSVREALSADTAARALGITVTHTAPGAVTAHMSIRPEMLNGHGSAHGAALFAVADIHTISEREDVDVIDVVEVLDEEIDKEDDTGQEPTDGSPAGV